MSNATSELKIHSETFDVYLFSEYQAQEQTFLGIFGIYGK